MAGAYRAFGETLRGLKTTFARIVEGPVTIQYPEEKTPVYPRFRGRHKLHRFEDTGLEKCVGCSLCAAACPADCIRVVAAENTPENRVSAGERYAAVYEINLSRCIFCGYCEVACPFDAITMGHDYELSDYTRSDLIFTKEMLLAEPIERTPLRSGGRVSSSSVLFFIAAIGALAGAIGVVTLRNPFYSVLALVVPPDLAGGAVPAAARRVRRRRAGRRLRRRGDGPVRVRGRLRRRRRGAGRRQRRCAILGPLFALALAIELCIAMLGSALKGDLGARARRTCPGSAPRKHIGTLFLTKYLFPFEVASLLLLVAAIGAVVLARRRRGLEEPDEQLELRHPARRARPTPARWPRRPASARRRDQPPSPRSSRSAAPATRPRAGRLVG